MGKFAWENREGKKMISIARGKWWIAVFFRNKKIFQIEIWL